MRPAEGLDQATLLAVVDRAAVMLPIKVGLRIMRDHGEQRGAGSVHPVLGPDGFGGFGSAHGPPTRR